MNELNKFPRRELKIALYLTALAYVIHFFFLGFLIGPFDYDHLSGYYDLAARFWRQQAGSLPQYNPYLCGGRTLGGDPQIPIFHPLILLVPLLGPTLVIKWEMLTQLLLGSWGFLKILEWFDVKGSGRLWGLFLFVASGGVVAKFMVGHVTLGFYCLYPLFLYLSYRLSARFDPTLFMAYLGLFIYSGLYKPNFLIYGVPPLLVEALVRSAIRRDVRSIGYAVAGVIAGTLCDAVTYLPAWRYFHDFPRMDASLPQYIEPYAFLANLLLPLKAIPKAFYGPGFLQRHEYNQFLGPVALWYAVFGLRKSSHRRAEKGALIAFILFSAWMGIGMPEGSAQWLFPYRWFYAVWPGFHSVRVPPRFWFGTMMGLTILSAIGWRSPRGRGAQVILLTLGVLPLFLSAVVNLSKTTVQATRSQWSVREEDPSTITQVFSEPTQSYPFLRRGIGVIRCVDNVEALTAKGLQEGDTIKILQGQASVQRLSWSRIAIRGAPSSNPDPSLLSLNFNASPYWSFEGKGARLLPERGAPMTLLVENTAEGTLVYHQPYVKESLWISGISISLIILLFVWFRRRKSPPPEPRGYQVGLTGGIASGKSSVAQILRKQGIPVVDLDLIGRELIVSSPEVQQYFRSLLGETVFVNSQIDRAKIREILFSDRAKRSQVESFLHPRILKRYQEEFAKLRKQGHRLVVCEAALLVDTGYYRNLDELIVVTASESQRIERLIQRDSISHNLAHKIVAAQLADDSRLKVSTHVVANTGSFSQLESQVNHLVTEWQHRGLIEHRRSAE